MRESRPAYVIGDLHGQFEKLCRLLIHAGLVDNSLSWQGKDSRLVFLGDFFDRGPEGIGCVELIMRLQDQARLTGGKVLALLGNHEIMILSAQRFSQRLTDGPGGSFLDDWLYNGGQIADLQRLTEAHIAWLSNLPALLVVEEHLLLHSDAVFYQQYGASAAEVNAVFRAGMHSQQTSFFEQVLKNFGERGAFLDGQLGKARCWQMLDQFGGKRIVHGHTPIAKVLGCPGSEVQLPLMYADGLAVNVDGGLYMGGKGFVYQMEYI